VDFLSKDDIYHTFEKYGKILAISLHKGYAFMQFKNPEMAELAATSENGRRVKGACLEVNLALISKEEARKLPREGATLAPIHRFTPQCRIFLESEHERMYSSQIERKLRILGVTVDTCIWKETARKTRNSPTLDDYLLELQNDSDSICAIQISRDDVAKLTATVHIFKTELEGKKK
jgi:RNA recognition motif-containing protein